MPHVRVRQQAADADGNIVGTGTAADFGELYQGTQPRPRKKDGGKVRRKRPQQSAGPHVEDTAPKAPRRVDPHVPAGFAYTVELAADAVSKCRGCRSVIGKGELRIGKLVKVRQEAAPTGRQLQWYKGGCGCLIAKDAALLYDVAQLHNFGKLGAGEQELLRTAIEAASVVHIQEKQMLSRLMYPNPVCMLTTPHHSDTGCGNVMTISWLTPLNNFGLLLLSVNAKRHSATKLRACANFVLNVPAANMQDTVLAIGKKSGRDGDKIASLAIRLCRPGWHQLEHSKPMEAAPPNPFAMLCVPQYVPYRPQCLTLCPYVAREDDNEEDSGADTDAETGATESSVSPTGPIAIDTAVCHVTCSVESMEEVEGHWLVRAQMDNGYVRRRYWNGKQFCARGGAPPFLTFLGSQRFGYRVQKLAPSCAPHCDAAQCPR
eukprot:COSAG01_NODE_1133_length_11566_cov_25.815819_8_plen_432_part_00